MNAMMTAVMAKIKKNPALHSPAHSMMKSGWQMPMTTMEPKPKRRGKGKANMPM